MEQLHRHDWGAIFSYVSSAVCQQAESSGNCSCCCMGVPVHGVSRMPYEKIAQGLCAPKDIGLTSNSMDQSP